jgi:DNA-directed RNA polymerase subunit alpha
VAEAGGVEAPVVTGGDNDILIDELELSVRSFNCLKRAGVETIGQLLQKSESELGAIPNFGQKSIEEVIENLQGRGYELRQD